MRTMPTLAALLAASSLVAAQGAAAATRSSSSMPTASVASAAQVDRVGASVGDSEELVAGLPLWVIILIFGSVAAFIIAISGGPDSQG